MSFTRSAPLIAVTTVLTSVLLNVSYGTAHAAAAGTAKKEPVTLTELRRQAQQAYRELEEATKTLEARRKQQTVTQRKLAATLEELQKANQELRKMRRPLVELVTAVYQNPTMRGLSPFLTSGDGTATLRAMSDVDYLVAGRNNVLGRAEQMLRRQERLAAEAQRLRSANLLQQAQVNAEIDMLRKRSSALVKTLTQKLIKIGVKINKSNQGGCDPTKVDLAEQYPNGLLPREVLCPLPGKPNELLRADAAIALADLDLAFRKRFGRPLCVSDAYRSLAEQQAIYYRRPGYAAVPGRSNHGYGLAVDLCGGIQIFRSAEFNWMEANAKRFGWFHPDWAYRSPFEPWHWEYDPKLAASQL
ncbi:D-alanyl-D-alanine carboxypeptidase family protein [Thermobispora bispora]|uniref:Peptidase M15B and M15C DD-carboxypeptidase VanY/endolysin n=1 Tax=Thermobispora bispora (strain ATCC 19993 / DSM 43833 / CBS 139.67 / JCM 10125 / KCTC 9307 / NBRC 14880 / R51) TaxID=469371 RepID=D6Y8F1_THEBD|nr:D-alanyl-D-alanine carboxypeptidase family protein [Thermobispora bispora]ADG89887.1 peptidase M15B and M15C DD-carboxypeptidase VanY/endolysin [Thermobispora bispora DSM 43833]